VTVSTDGVDLAVPAPVAAATTAAVAASTGTGVLETALKAALAGGTVVHLTDTSYTVTSSIVINITASFQGPLGIDLGGAKILSQITGGGPVIQINIAAGRRYRHVVAVELSRSRATPGRRRHQDRGRRRRSLDPRPSISGTSIIEHVGGIGLDVLGNVQGSISTVDAR
jgi:hypothetical protein